jgi:nitrate reductase NapAB chaperone NapD
MTPEDWKIIMNSKTKEILEQTIKALENVPEVNGVYDQQHSDTQIAAILKLKEIITNDNGTY